MKRFRGFTPEYVNPGKCESDELAQARLEMEKAKQDYDDALVNFNFADDEHFEVANTELTLTKLRFDSAYNNFMRLAHKGTTKQADSTEAHHITKETIQEVEKTEQINLI